MIDYIPIDTNIYIHIYTYTDMHIYIYTKISSGGGAGGGGGGEDILQWYSRGGAQLMLGGCGTLKMAMHAKPARDPACACPMAAPS